MWFKKNDNAASEILEEKKQIEFILGITRTGLDIIDSEYNMVYIDPAWARIYGDPAGKKCYEYFMGRSQPCPQCGVREAFKTKRAVITEEILSRENNRPVRITTVPFRNKKGQWCVAEVATDAAGCEHAEGEFKRRSESELEGVFDAIPVGVVLLKDRVFKKVNRAFCAIIGYSEAELIGRSTSMIYPSKEEHHRAGQKLYGMVKDNRMPEVETRLKRKDGVIIDALLSASPLDPGDPSSDMIGTISDITDRKKSEQALQESETKFRELFEHMTSGVVVYSATDDGRNFIITDINPAVERIEQIGRQDVMNKRVSEAFPGIMSFGLLDVFKRVFKTGVSEYYASALYKDDRIGECWRENWVYKLPTGELVVVYNDVTERKKAEVDLRDAYRRLQEAQAELIQSEKMAAVGKFSSGIAHEVKNPLGVILGGAEFLQAKLTGVDEDSKLVIKKIKDAALRADAILRTILQYARPSSLKIERVSLDDMVAEVTALFNLQPDLIKAEIVTECAPRDIMVDVDKNQMHQVIFNLVKNAIEATQPEKGKVIIRTGIEGGAAYIEIIDNGCGMSKETRARLFEPFFTTKAAKKGTGLGMFVARTIVNNHSGELIVKSELGKGTDVRIVLPNLMHVSGK